MSIVKGEVVSASYFWSCLTLSDECPFFSVSDPKLYYFGVGLIIMYAAFLLMLLADFNFYMTIDIFQQRIDYCINFVKKKLRHIEIDQRRLVSAQERMEKQIKRSKETTKIVQALRGALSKDDPSPMQALTGSINDDNFEAKF